MRLSPWALVLAAAVVWSGYVLLGWAAGLTPFAAELARSPWAALGERQARALGFVYGLLDRVFAAFLLALIYNWIAGRVDARHAERSARMRTLWAPAKHAGPEGYHPSHPHQTAAADRNVAGGQSPGESAPALR